MARSSFFNPENALWSTVGQITDVIFLSLFWLICCIPVVTIAPAGAALYDAMWRTFRRGEPRAWQRFFKSFRQNLKAGIPVSILWAIPAGGLGWCAIQVWNAAVYGQIGWGVFAGVAFLAFTVVGLLALVFPLFSRFETGVGQLFSNALRLGLGNLLHILALAAIHTVGLFLCLRYIFPAFFLPAVMALLSTFFVEPILKPFMPPEENEE